MNLALFHRQLAQHGQNITLQNRSITPPVFGFTDFDETFSGDSIVKAIIDTTRGKTLFDGVATDRPITHRFCILYVAGVTAETWITFGGRRFDIIDVENCEERNQVLILRCTERGTGEAAKI